MDKFFLCKNCGQEVSQGGQIGTHNRNHCPFCLYSLHVDSNVSGDRGEKCHGLMKPIALTFKKEGKNKYGNEKQGEIMLVHLCQKCDKISINRIAGDDDESAIYNIFLKSLELKLDIKKKLLSENIQILRKIATDEVKIQLFGDLPK